MSIFRADKAVERLEERLGRVENLTADLQRENRKLGLEYIELYDKVSHQMSRMAKRHAANKPEPLNDEPVVPDDDGLDPISRKIIERRGTLRRIS